MPRYLYALAGSFVGAFVDLLVNLLAAALEQQPFGSRLISSVWWLVGMIMAGLFIGYWLGERLILRPNAKNSNGHQGRRVPIEITRLRALLSYGKLRGTGIRLDDILLIASRFDIDSKD